MDLKQDIVHVNERGLYCPSGDFYIDPWKPVETAVITHAHSDHARVGSKKYFSSATGMPFVRHRLGSDIKIDGIDYGRKIKMGRCWVSLHPAGHIAGSSQVRIEEGSRVWVISGDYKRTPDPSCEAFEVVPCNVFVSEATFALPIYNWESGETTARKIFDWWQSDLSRPSILFCYALGKSQRVLAELKRLTDKTVYLHGAVESLTEIYRAQGVEMLPTRLVSEMEKGYSFAGDLIIAPPSGHHSPWMKRFKDPQTAFASGWMQVRGNRRRKGYEKGFVLSDHADWNELNQTIRDTGCETVFLTHGKTDVLARYLKEIGIGVRLFKTEFQDDEDQS